MDTPKTNSMKIVLTPLLMLPISLLTQPVINAADVTPAWGGAATMYDVETAIAAGPTGANFVFNPGAITPGTSMQSQTVQPASSPYAGTFPTATHANTSLVNPEMYSYTRIQADGVYMLGFAGPDYSMVYSNSDRTFALPLTNGTTWTDQWSATSTIAGMEILRTGTTSGA